MENQIKGLGDKFEKTSKKIEQKVKFMKIEDKILGNQNPGPGDPISQQHILHKERTKKKEEMNS